MTKQDSNNKILQKMLQDLEDEVRNEPGVSEEVRKEVYRKLGIKR